LLGAAGLLALLLPVAIGMANTAHLNAQPQAESATEQLPSFEVISIRGHNPGYLPAFGGQPQFNPDGIVWENMVVQ
jgi:hypothetical protein